MGFDCFEVCLGRGTVYEDRLRQVEGDMMRADALNIPMSVHLPVYLPAQYPYDYLDAYFLDNDEEKRVQSMTLLEENLERLSQHKVSYMVLHFPGVYPIAYVEEDIFNGRLESCLGAMNALAHQYQTKILLEYFGSNGMFYEPKQWVERLKPYKHLGLLMDTGHLWFASRLRGFSFEAALECLIPHAEAFHLWTCRGEGVYGDNECYKQYHHILPEFSHQIKQGWAFELAPLLLKLKETGKPIIIEASPTYGGTEHFLNGIQVIKEYMR